MTPNSSLLTPHSKIYVAGHRGMVGSAIVRKLQQEGYENIITRTHDELDLTNQSAVEIFFSSNEIDYVVIAAAKVGGIYANNNYPAEFIYQNLIVEANLIHNAWKAGVKKLLFLGSSCIYPKFAKQPIKESELLSGKLEPTNEPYAVAKIAGIKLCESYNRQYGTNYRSVMPTNLYGPYDNFDLRNSHVLPAVMRKIHDAKIQTQIQVELWGSGRARREFLHVDDMAAACFFVMNLDLNDYRDKTDPLVGHINIGTGKDLSIKELAQLINKVVGYQGEIKWNIDMPDGMLQKLLDVTKIEQLGWMAQIDLGKGIANTYKWFLEHYDSIRKNS
jgi:GDP-L-fucose synthase